MTPNLSISYVKSKTEPLCDPIIKPYEDLKNKLFDKNQSLVISR